MVVPAPARPVVAPYGEGAINSCAPFLNRILYCHDRAFQATGNETTFNGVESTKSAAHRSVRGGYGSFCGAEEAPQGFFGIGAVPGEFELRDVEQDAAAMALEGRKADHI